MHEGRTVFAQLMDFMPKYEFSKCVRRHRGDYHVRSLTCYEQFLIMAFAQLTWRESLRDIETCLRAFGPKLYHAGLRSRVSRSTLADANEKRPWQIYADFAQVLIACANVLYANEDFSVELQQAASALDSTTIDLCLALFPWATFRQHKAAIKLHTLLHLRGGFPTVVIVTSGKVHDVNILDDLGFEPGAFYIFDRGYLDFARLHRIHRSGAFFVTRAKKNSAMALPLLASRRQVHWTALRSDGGVDGLLLATAIPRRVAAHRLSRSDYRQEVRVSDQQLHVGGAGDCPVVSCALADRVVFQVDQTAPANQGVLRDQRERREDAQSGLR
jgi:hypothetical protein